MKWITSKSIQLLFSVRTEQKGLMFEDNKASSRSDIEHGAENHRYNNKEKSSILVNIMLLYGNVDKIQSWVGHLG